MIVSSACPACVRGHARALVCVCCWHACFLLVCLCVYVAGTHNLFSSFVCVCVFGPYIQLVLAIGCWEERVGGGKLQFCENLIAKSTATEGWLFNKARAALTVSSTNHSTDFCTSCTHCLPDRLHLALVLQPFFYD